MSTVTRDVRLAIAQVPVLDQVLREGARRMLQAAIEREVADYVEAHAQELDGRGRRLVVRNGHLPPRQLQTPVGPIRVQQPRVDDRRTDPRTGITAAASRIATACSMACLRTLTRLSASASNLIAAGSEIAAGRIALFTRCGTPQRLVSVALATPYLEPRQSGLSTRPKSRFPGFHQAPTLCAARTFLTGLVRRRA